MGKIINLYKRLYNKLFRYNYNYQIRRKIIKKGGRIGKNISLNINGNFTYGKKFVVNDEGIDVFTKSKIIVYSNASLCIGDFSGITSTSIICTSSISIGRHVNIGAGCLIMDSNFHSLDWQVRGNRSCDGSDAKRSPIKIGDYAFIGARCIICKGVTIGEKSIIAAGSIVVSDIPSCEIWGGNPARFIKCIQ